MRYWQLLAALVALVMCDHAAAGAVKVRAREHYESMQLRTDTDRATYAGLSNTINIWWEDPYRYSIGLAGGPLFGRIFSKKPLPGFAGEISVRHFGVEFKAFPDAALTPVFLRAGLFDCTVRSRGEAKNPHGFSQLIGVGYEYDFRGVGIAPEVSWRWLQISDRIFGVGIAPAIGVHFYKNI